VLVVVEHRDVEQLAKPCLDLEAARSGDVLEVDASEPRGDCHDSLHNLVRIGGRETDGPCVDTGELLEEDRLAFHHGQGRLRADVAEPEHGGAVGDDRDRVGLAREAPDQFGIVGDCAAGARDTRGVRHREVIRRLERHPGGDLELSAAMEPQGAVGDVFDFDSVLRAHRRRDPGDCAPRRRRGP